MTDEDQGVDGYDERLCVDNKHNPRQYVMIHEDFPWWQEDHTNTQYSQEWKVTNVVMDFYTMAKHSSSVHTWKSK